MVNLCIKLLKQSGIANLSISVLFSLVLLSALTYVVLLFMHILHSQGNNNQSITVSKQKRIEEMLFKVAYFRCSLSAVALLYRATPPVDLRSTRQRWQLRRS